jgi:E3 ubiquitin-protein ligase listerin
VAQAVQASKLPGVTVEDLYPSTTAWMKELYPFLEAVADPSLSITNSLGGAYYLVKPNPAKDHVNAPGRDRNGLSVPARMATYASQLIAHGVKHSSLPNKIQVETLYLLYIVVQITSDQLALMDEGKLWNSLAPEEALADAEQLVSSFGSLMNAEASQAKGWGEGIGSGTSTLTLLDDLARILIDEAKNPTPLGLYSARALSELLQALTEWHGFPSRGEGKLAELELLVAPTPETVLGATAILTGFGESLESSKLVSNLCNRLVSDIAGAKLDSDKTLLRLVLLNACMQVYEPGSLPVANNRLVFAVRQISSWLEDYPLSSGDATTTEICRALQRLLPCVKSVYGQWWKNTVQFCTDIWEGASSGDIASKVAVLHSSLKLMASLESMEDRNDDLEDALTELAGARSSCLLSLLERPRHRSTQPLEIVDALLCRQVEKIPTRMIKDPADIYCLVASDSRTIQTAAFGLLHRVIPEQQEKYAFDVLLDNLGESSHSCPTDRS